MPHFDDYELDLPHEKCGEEAEVESIFTNSKGEILFKMFCPVCSDEFSIRLSMMRLTAEALLSDRSFDDIREIIMPKAVTLIN